MGHRQGDIIVVVKYSKVAGLLILGFFLLSPGSLILADDFSSTNFKISNPVINGGVYSSSASFKLQSSLSQISIGTSTSVSFGVNAGFLYFPLVNTPVVGATAGNAQVALSWTASMAFLGWSVSGYSVGQGTISGGPYTYTPVGAVLSNTVTGLSNGTTYYFVIVAKDSFNNFIATSTQVSASPSAPATPPAGGGGGGGGGLAAGSVINFSGRAYPKSTVTLLKDAQVVSTTVAGTDANFQISLNNVSSGNYIFSVYGEDRDGRRSGLLSFPVGVTPNSTTNITGIFLAPSIGTDKSEVKRGDNLAIFGQSVPKGNITVLVNSDEDIFLQTKTDVDGIYLANLDTSPLEYGGHTAKSKAATSTEISAFGAVAAFAVGTKNVSAKPTAKCPAKGDVNSDCRVNLVDFSITAFWYQRPINATFANIEKAKLNGDGLVNLIDFSIMAYYWTG